jgi:branched-chain amino acid transport system substrate-binding protein
MVETLGVSHVAVIYESSNYGQALAEVFKDNFEANNGHTAELFAFDEGNSTGRDDKVSTVGASVYDEVLFISGNIDDLIAFLNGAATWPNYENMGIFLTDAGRDVRLIENTAEASSLYDQIQGTAPSVPTGTVYGFFESGFSGTYSPAYTASSSSYTAYSYDAAWLGLYGTAWSLYQESDACVGDDDGICGLGTARGLRHISDQNATDMEIKSTSWNSVKATFETGQSVNIEGASGSLDYDPLSGETTGPIDIWVINDARDNFDTIKTITP